MCVVCVCVCVCLCLCSVCVCMCVCGVCVCGVCLCVCLCLCSVCVCVCVCVPDHFAPPSELKFSTTKEAFSRSQWPHGLRRRSAAARLLRSWVRIPPEAWMSVCCECCVLCVVR